MEVGRLRDKITKKNGQTLKIDVFVEVHTTTVADHLGGKEKVFQGY